MSPLPITGEFVPALPPLQDRTPGERASSRRRAPSHQIKPYSARSFDKYDKHARSSSWKSGFGNSITDGWQTSNSASIPDCQRSGKGRPCKLPPMLKSPPVLKDEEFDSIIVEAFFRPPLLLDDHGSGLDMSPEEYEEYVADLKTALLSTLPAPKGAACVQRKAAAAITQPPSTRVSAPRPRPRSV